MDSLREIRQIIDRGREKKIIEDEKKAIDIEKKVVEEEKKPVKPLKEENLPVKGKNKVPGHDKGKKSDAKSGVEKDDKYKILSELKKRKNEKAVKAKSASIKNMRNAILMKFSAVAGLMLVTGGIAYAGYKGIGGINNEDDYSKFKVEEAVGEAESGAAYNLIKEILKENAKAGKTGGIGYFWSHSTDDETRLECELVLAGLSDTDLTFQSVKKIPGQILQVKAIHKETPVSFLLDSSSRELSLRFVHIEQKQ